MWCYWEHIGEDIGNIIMNQIPFRTWWEHQNLYPYPNIIFHVNVYDFFQILILHVPMVGQAIALPMWLFLQLWVWQVLNMMRWNNSTRYYTFLWLITCNCWFQCFCFVFGHLLNQSISIFHLWISFSICDNFSDIHKNCHVFMEIKFNLW